MGPRNCKWDREVLSLGHRGCHWGRGVVNGTEELSVRQRNCQSTEEYCHWDTGVVNGTHDLSLGLSNCQWDRGILSPGQRNCQWDRRVVNGTEVLSMGHGSEVCGTVLKKPNILISFFSSSFSFFSNPSLCLFIGGWRGRCLWRGGVQVEERGLGEEGCFGEEKARFQLLPLEDHVNPATRTVRVPVYLLIRPETRPQSLLPPPPPHPTP